ncbi:MAG TPA: hypothetical protein VHY33_04215 [Thermoanaerobaculia bacterium]|jgi:hypothetical protein|nr:hypothetical protein [Thermoanaerobaculia bacterium]
MNILFDSMGTQVQVQNETSNHLVTLLNALDAQGTTYSFTDYTQPISQQLDGVDVLVILTHYPATQPGYTPAIPNETSFDFSETDLTGIPAWVNNGGQLLFISNHTFYTGFDAVLAGALGITIVPAGFEVAQLPFTPLALAVMQVPKPAPRDWLLPNVYALLSCGVAPGNGTVLYSFPPNVSDTSGSNYSPADYAFAVEFSYSNDGTVIMAARSGLCGDAGTGYPAPGEVAHGSNLSFILNCINYLGGTIS